MIKNIKVTWQGGNKIGGYCLLFTDAKHVDKHGTYFSRDTELGLYDYSLRPVYWNHGMKGLLDPIGRVYGLDDDLVGVQVDARLALGTPAGRRALTLIHQGKLYWSVGSNPAVISKKSTGEYERFPIIEVSLTTTPAGARTSPTLKTRQQIIAEGHASYRLACLKSMIAYGVDMETGLKIVDLLPNPYGG